MEKRKTRAAFAKYIFSMLLFGTNGIVASFIGLNSYEIVWVRTLIGSLFLGLLFFLTRGKLTFFRHKKQFLYLGISGVAMGVSWMLLYEAYAQIGVSIATLLYYTGPVIVMALSPFLFKERMTVVKAAGFLAVLCGIFLVNGGIPNAQGSVLGIVCGLLSAVTYALMVIFNKKAKEITGVENTLFQLIFGFLTVSAFVFIKQGFSIRFAPSDWLPALILGVVNTGFGCYLYFSSIGKLSVQTVAVCGYLEPLSAVIFSVLFLNEVMRPLQILGAFLIIGGAVLGEAAVLRSRAK